MMLWTASCSALLAIALAVSLWRLRGAIEEGLRLKKLADATSEAVAIVASGRITTANTAFSNLLGLSGTVLIGRPLVQFLVEEGESRVLGALTGRLADPMQTSILNDQGEPIPVELQANPVGPLSTRLSVVRLRDLRRRMAEAERISFLTAHDPMTGLANRQYFTNKLTQAVDHARLEGERLAVVMIDILKFREFNERSGHGRGDAVLKAFAQHLLVLLGHDHMAARLSGNEFAILMRHSDQPSSASHLVHLLASDAARHLELDEDTVTLNLAMGISIFPEDAASAPSLLTTAATALQEAKCDSGSPIRFFEPGINQQQQEQRELEADLRMALERNELSLYLQPLSSIEDGQVTGFEALLRWRHPVRGQIPPSRFIPIAEAAGLIGPISAWVLKTACAEAASWDRPLRISVNVSPVQFDDPNFVDEVIDIVIASGIDPARLELEITEGVLIADTDRALEILNRLKAVDIRIVMDDFGTGYSSLGYLQKFPFDKIKIDRMFVMDLGAKPEAEAIIRAIVGLAHGLDIPVVAEGVETNEQLEALRRESCDQVQGYLLGKPQPALAFQPLVGRKPDVETDAQLINR